MKILVINGSPYKEKSTTLKITKAFLAGMGESAEIVNTIDQKIQPCRGCYACWMKTNGICVQKDDATLLLEKIKQADLVIWSIPVFCYSAPASVKALMDRTLSFNKPEMYVGTDGRAHHYGYEDGSKKTVLITSGGLPDVEGNFDGLIFQLRHMFGQDTPAICMAEASLFANPKATMLTDTYLSYVKIAGQEYSTTGKISPQTQSTLDSLLIPRDEFIASTNHIFELLKNGTLCQ